MNSVEAWCLSHGLPWNAEIESKLTKIGVKNVEHLKELKPGEWDEYFKDEPIITRRLAKRVLKELMGNESRKSATELPYATTTTSGSGLQKRNNNMDPEEEDFEAQIKKLGSPTNKVATAFAAASSSDSFSPGGGSTTNPVFLAKIILRKVFDLVSSDDENPNTTHTGAEAFVILIRDVTLGVILGLLTISLLIFLDHRNIVHFESAHNFRNAAFNLMNDPETIATLEESSDLKFITLEQYESQRKEIEGTTEKLKSNQEVLAQRMKELDEKVKEATPMREEHKTLMNNPLLGMDKYCGGCVWADKTSCDQRAQFMQDKHKMQKFAAKMSAMEVPTCKN